MLMPLRVGSGNGNTSRMPAWFAWSLLALVSWGIWAIIARLIGNALSPAQSQALCTLGILPVIAVLGLMPKKQLPRNLRKGIGIALAAGVLSCLGNVAYYYALNRGGKVATVVPLTAMYPLVTIFLAMAILQERVTRFQIGGVTLSLIAIYFLNVTPGSGFLNAGLLYALLPIAFWGITGFLQKLSTNDISGELSTLWFLAAFVPAAAVILAIQPPPPLPANIWLWTISLGFFFALGNLAILIAFARNGKASIITPLTALYPVVSIPLAIMLFDENISARETTGILCALGSVVMLSWQGAAACGNARPQERLEHEIHH